MKKLLVISNNVLSLTNNNGKTIYSFINGLKDVSVSQLYFSGEIPRIKGYSYFKISDKDIIHGILDSTKRGSEVVPAVKNDSEDDFSLRNMVGRNKFTLLARELLWYRKWKSSKLLKWLDSINPDAILFVAGDSIFAYDICSFIQKRYSSRLTVYVTDDYVMSRKQESLIEKKRRKIIKGRMDYVLNRSKCFYTISKPMQTTYKELFNKDSYLAVNMASDLRDESIKKTEDEIILLYAGSFYYGRAQVLGKLALSIRNYNEKHESKAKLLMYCNREPSDEIKKVICVSGASEYRGSLDSEQLKVNLNMADILVFVESFDPEQVEKVKFSLSTKIPEYMSVGKPIIAIGPPGIGSMDYLKDVAFCITNNGEISDKIEEILQNRSKQLLIGEKARKKFLNNHNRLKNQSQFLENVLGLNGVTK